MCIRDRDTSSLKVIVNVEEADILKIQEGMPATVSTDATGDEEIKGTVTRVVRVKNQSTNTNGTDTNTSVSYTHLDAPRLQDCISSLIHWLPLRCHDRPEPSTAPHRHLPGR